MVCTHLINLRKTIPAADGYEDCLKTEVPWVRLRRYSHVGCKRR
jgi:hypothetical protein